MTVDERIESLEKELKALKKERAEEKEKKYEFPCFLECPDGAVGFLESAEGYSCGSKDGQGWVMSDPYKDSYYFGYRSETWNIEKSEPFNGTLKIKDGKVIKSKAK